MPDKELSEFKERITANFKNLREITKEALDSPNIKKDEVMEILIDVLAEQEQDLDHWIKSRYEKKEE